MLTDIIPFNRFGETVGSRSDHSGKGGGEFGPQGSSFPLYPESEIIEMLSRVLIFRYINRGVRGQEHHIHESQKHGPHCGKHETNGFAGHKPLVENPEIPGGFQTSI